jgi:hypothetical protein
LTLAADALLACRGIEKPTRQQRVGAMLDAEFKLLVIKTLSARR